jgi:hypothetical protein
MQTDHGTNVLVDSIDTGTQIFNIKAERTKKGLFVTSYCQLVTVRSKHLHLGRVLDLFVDMTIMACGLDDEEHETTADNVEQAIRDFATKAFDEL